MSGEEKYTLDEARRILARETCGRQGRDLERMHFTGDAAGYVAVEHWICSRHCGVRVELSCPD